MSAPTEQALRNHDSAARQALIVSRDTAAPQDLRDLALSVALMAEGLKHVATGQRATYLLLSEVKQLLQKQVGNRW